MILSTSSGYCNKYFLAGILGPELGIAQALEHALRNVHGMPCCQLEPRSTGAPFRAVRGEVTSSRQGNWIVSNKAWKGIRSVNVDHEAEVRSCPPRGKRRASPYRTALAWRHQPIVKSSRGAGTHQPNVNSPRRQSRELHMPKEEVLKPPPKERSGATRATV